MSAAIFFMREARIPRRVLLYRKRCFLIKQGKTAALIKMRQSFLCARDRKVYAAYAACPSTTSRGSKSPLLDSSQWETRGDDLHPPISSQAWRLLFKIRILTHLLTHHGQNPIDNLCSVHLYCVRQQPFHVLFRKPIVKMNHKVLLPRPFARQRSG